MSTIICDFMGDSYTENIAERLCDLNKKKFSHIIAHRKPKKTSSLSNLNFMDATLLYRHSSISSAFQDTKSSSISADVASKFSECLFLFLSSMDRTTPILQSVNATQTFFWDLLGYYFSFFNKNKEIDSIIFDSIPHLPWNICLFYVAKYLGLRVLILRRTCIAGYMYIDEDFRPKKSNWKFTYKELYNPLNTIIEKENTFEKLKNLSFTKNQVKGQWPKDWIEKKQYFEIFLDFLRKLGLQNLIFFVRIFLYGPQNNVEGATINTSHRTTLAGINPLNRWSYFKLHNSYLRILKKQIKNYNKLKTSNIDLSKPYIYLALHYQPEASTLPEGMIFSDQLLIARNLAEALPKDWKLVIKEHPRQMTYDLRAMHARNNIYYENFLKNNNVIFASTDLDQNLLIEKCKITATVSGSVGWEGLLKLKPSILFSENWHSRCNSSRYVSSKNEIEYAINNLSKKTKEEIKSDVCLFIKEISGYLINAVFSKKHLQIFFKKSNQEKSLNNITSAILQRLD